MRAVASLHFHTSVLTIPALRALEMAESKKEPWECLINALGENIQDADEGRVIT